MMRSILGVGQYDNDCERVRQQANAAAAVLILIEGNNGSGLSVCGDQASLEQLPHLLEQLAYQMRRDFVMPEAARARMNYQPGTVVEKFTGDYKAVGEVRGVFTTRNGKLRYAVELDAGMLMIYSHKNLRPPMRNLTEDERATMSRGHCPDCNHRGFVLGPRGGAAINVACGGCDKKFNVTTFGHEVVMGQRLEDE